MKYIENCLGEKVFDVIQVWCTTMNESQYKFEFQKKINLIFEQEKTGWILTDQHFYKLDSGFMETFVLTQTTDLLNECKYTGPLEEFQKARDFLEEGRNKEAIDHAYMAYESILKVVTGNSDGQFSELIRQLPEGYFTGLPAGVAPIFRNKVFGSLPLLRNKLGGHGQGELSFIVSREYAELALHLSGSLIIFLIKRQAAMAPEVEEAVEQSSNSNDDDDIPF